MHVNKVYRVRTIDRVAKDLGEDVCVFHGIVSADSRRS